MSADIALLNSWRGWLTALTPAAMLALSNPGLMRRAEREAAAAAPPFLQAEGERLAVVIGDRRVTLGPAGPQAARCPCPAPGLCVHVLAALLLARAALGETPPAPGSSDALPDSGVRSAPDAGDALEEALSVPLVALRRAAGGAAGLRRAWRMAGSATVAVERGDGGALLLRLSQPPLALHWLPGAGLEGIVSRAPPREAGLLHVVALLALQQAHARLPPELAQATLPPLPPSAVTLLGQVQRPVVDLAVQGLAAVPQTRLAALQRLVLLLPTAGLHRPARALQRLLRQLHGFWAAHAGVDPETLLMHLARLAALIEALQRAEPQALPALMGRARDDYAALPPVSLLPIGRRGWGNARTGGMQLLFWAPEQAQIFAWNRADRVRGTAAGAHIGAVPPQAAFDAAVGRTGWTLHDGRLGDGGRLSLPGPARLIAGGPVPADWTAALPWVDRLASLESRFAALRPLGLAPAAGTRLFAWLRGFAWAAPRVDRLQPGVEVLLTDSAGEALRLRLPWRDDTRHRARRLAALGGPYERAAAPGVLAELSMHSGRWQGEPITLLMPGEGAVPLESEIAPLPPPLPLQPPATASPGRATPLASFGRAEPALAAALLALRRALADIALSGTALTAPGQAARLQAALLAERLAACGLHSIAIPCREALSAADPAAAATALLRCAYRLDLALAL